MDTELRRGFWLADRHVAPLHGEIAGQSGRQRVHPKAMEVLLCLARSPGKVVERQRLIEAVWNGAPASHVALTHCISELRHLLGDDPHRPTFIETVPKLGYRLLVPVTPTQEQRPIPVTESVGSGNGFIAELRRRKVFRVAAVYALLAWLIIQIAETTFDPLGIPLWGQTVVIVILLLGFPVAIAPAWALELTRLSIGTLLSIAGTPTLQRRYRPLPFQNRIATESFTAGGGACAMIFEPVDEKYSLPVTFCAVALTVVSMPRKVPAYATPRSNSV